MDIKRRVLVVAGILLLSFIVMMVFWRAFAWDNRDLRDPGLGVALLLFAVGIAGTITMIAVIMREIWR